MAMVHSSLARASQELLVGVCVLSLFAECANLSDSSLCQLPLGLQVCRLQP